MPADVEFSHPRLVAVYDSVNAYGPDTQLAFYPALAHELGARSVVDLGCGTGLVTCELARRGLQVTGADPAPAMLSVARARTPCGSVDWIEGGAEALGALEADLAIMTGHVAQFFIDDVEWGAALDGLQGALRPEGWLAFESRNPAAREWEGWTADAPATVDDPRQGRLLVWSEVEAERDGIVSYANHYRFQATGEELVSHSSLRFRTLDELEVSLGAGGFQVQEVFGDWDRRPAGPDAPELIVIAQAVGGARSG